MKRYLGMTEQEISENETAWAEERGDIDNAPADAPNVRSAGISPGGVQSDLEGLGPEPTAAGPAGGPDMAGATASPGAGTPGAAPAPAL